MTYLLSGLPLDTVPNIGWALVHFLWQGLLLAALLQAILPMCRSPVVRHGWALAILAAMALAPVATFFFLQQHGFESASQAAIPAMVPQNMDSAILALAPASIPPIWIDRLVVLWLAGIAVLTLRALVGCWLVESLRRCDVFALSPELLRRCRALQRRLAPSWPVSFLQSHRVGTPVVVGWFRPVILIPVAAITGIPPRQLDALILHELAHIRRFDAFTNIALVTVQTMLFFHPAVWSVTRRIRIEREHCCDDCAVSLCGDAGLYAEALTSLESWRAAPALGLAASGGKLKARVARLLDGPPQSRSFSFSAFAGLVFLCLGLVATGIATAHNYIPAERPGFAIAVVDENVGTNARNGPPSGDERVRMLTPGERALWLERKGKIKGDAVAEAHVSAGPDGRPVILFRLTPEARNQFAAMTRANVDRRLAILVNGRVVQTPIVREPITDGRGEISGNYTEAQARALAASMMRHRQPATP